MGRAWWWRISVGAAGLAVVAGVAWAVAHELRTSELQAAILARLGRDMTFALEPGPNPDIRFPTEGPYDRRLGYVLLPFFVDSLAAKGFAVEEQARSAATLDAFVARGGFPVFREKTRTGLTLLDRNGAVLFAAGFPERVYDSFDDIPPIVVDTLLFIENRELLDPGFPSRNPAVEWDRLAAAVVGQLVRRVDPSVATAGGSTLATQIEKFRHSPEGRTADTTEKLRQMVSASVRAYLDGADTREARRRIVVAYLSSTPLAARPGFGEVNGIGDGLWAWYGTDFATANRILREPAARGGTNDLTLRALVYKQVLSLLLAQRRPAHYLVARPQELGTLTDAYLRLLKGTGVIDPALADAALALDLRFEQQPPVPSYDSFLERKAATAARHRLLALLNASGLYQLDRLDLTAKTTLDLPTQRRVTEVLRRIAGADGVAELGLAGFRLLDERSDPGRVIYSVTLYERGADANHVRVQADNLDQPLDLNEGAKLELGSTAKLRALITYLEIVAELHGRLGQLPAVELTRIAAGAADELTRWTAGHLARATDRGLPALLEAAMARRYSASPHASFFTAGGVHQFANFNRDHDGRVITVTEAFRHSVNLVFIRMMRDIVEHVTARERPDFRELLADRSHPGRREYLVRFADREGTEFLDGFHTTYRGRSPDDALALLAGRVRRPTPDRLAVVFRSVRPEAGPAELGEFLRAAPQLAPGKGLDAVAVERLHHRYGPDRFSLADRAYIAGVYPLELWLVGYMQEAAPEDASRGAMLEASRDVRQEAYGWLFKTRHKSAQDRRIRILLEEDAFVAIGESWHRLGYPFGRLVPSYATAIGSSGDRPAALAELIGIVLNDGVRLPTARIERLHFAAGTPYETVVGRERRPGERVMAPEVAAAVRAALTDVVGQGTARRVVGSFAGPDGSALTIGGKTGTGDNRRNRYARGGRLIESRVINRTATFVFFIGDRYFGAITAHVAGPEAEKYRFTSSLPVQLLAALTPAFQPLIDGTEPRLADATAAVGAVPGDGTAAVERGTAWDNAATAIR